MVAPLRGGPRSRCVAVHVGRGWVWVWVWLGSTTGILQFWAGRGVVVAVAGVVAPAARCQSLPVALPVGTSSPGQVAGAPSRFWVVTAVCDIQERHLGLGVVVHAL